MPNTYCVMDTPKMAATESSVPSMCVHIANRAHTPVVRSAALWDVAQARQPSISTYVLMLHDPLIPLGIMVMNSTMLCIDAIHRGRVLVEDVVHVA